MPTGIYNHKHVARLRKGKTYQEIYNGNYSKIGFQKGELNPMKKDELKERMRKKHLGIKQSEEHKRKRSESLKGKSYEELMGKEKANNLKIQRGNIWRNKKLSEEHKRKISESKKGHSINLGNKHTKETKQKMSLAKQNMSEETKRKMSAIKQGIELDKWEKFTSREPYNQRFENKFKRQIRNRDNQICMSCKIHREKLKEALHIHHINYNKKLTIPENCISLCRPCHMKTNVNRNYWIPFFQSLLSENYNYQYENNIPIINLEVKNGIKMD